jgi:regulator of sigma E protease
MQQFNLPSIGIALVAVAFVLGVMIIIHELGHHLVAKFFGVRVDTFSVGFGKRLFGFKMGGTDYRVSALPFGGYVKMAGENPMEQRTGAPDEFMSHPRWQRILIGFAGPLMNVFLAIALLTAVFMIDYEHPTYSNQPAKVNYVEKDSPAAKAGVQPGDVITRIGSTQNPTWEDVRLKTLIATKDPVSLAVLRDGATIAIMLLPDSAPRANSSFEGMVPSQPIEVTQLDKVLKLYKAGIPIGEAPSPLYQAGAQEGDVIETIDGKSYESIPPIQDHLVERAGAPVALVVNHLGTRSTVTVTPVLLELENGVKRYRLGFVSEPTVHEKLSLAPAFSMSLDQNKKFSFLIVEMVKKMVQRKVGMKQLEGPVRIAQLSGEAARAPGWTPLMLLMAAISLNLGIMNLLPIPILDGGLILLTAIEGLIRRDINQRVKERIYQTAFVFLVMFAVVVVYNDVSKMLFSKYLP